MEWEQLNEQDEIAKKLVEIIENNKGKIISKLSNKMEVKNKGHGDIAYKFDIEIEHLFYEELKKRCGEIVILGEEKQYGERGRDYLIIDPVDGSTNAKRNLNFYGTMIAHLEGEKIEDVKSALVWDIPHDKIYLASRGKGAVLIEHGEVKKLEIVEMEPYGKDETLYDISPHSPMEAIMKMSKYGKFRHLGSLGLAVALVSEMTLDIAADLSGRARFVDVTAPLFILKEAGGHYIIEPEEPVDPSRHVLYIATWSKKLFDSLIKEVWPLRKKFNS
ncbi:MAG: inositol monophosphatase family protein [Candidatus Njordarchaeia archaeon]